MIRIDPSQLEIGKPLPMDVFDRKGNVLFQAGQVIEPAALEDHWQSLRGGLYIKDSMEGVLVGSPLPHDIYDQYGVLLLAKGTLVTPSFLEHLRARGQIGPNPADEEEQEQYVKQVSLHTPTTRRLDKTVESQAHKAPSQRFTWPDVRMSLSEFREASARAVEQFDTMLDHYHQFGQDLLNGTVPRSARPQEQIQRLFRMFRGDRHLPLMLLNLRKMDKDYLFAHGVKVSLLAMSMAMRLGYGEQEVADVGLGALLQDIGMLRVPEEIRMAPRPLTPMEWLEIQHHPIYTADLLDSAGIRSQLTLLVGYQAHERCDQSGYPRHRPRLFIHPLSRIVAAADTYIALISPRPYRQAFSPYDSNVKLLNEAHAGRLDRTAVRALLDCISLFPVGSGVILSDDTRAKVIRSNPGLHTRPVVVPLNDDGSETDEELDLSQCDNLEVVGVFDLPYYVPEPPLSAPTPDNAPPHSPQPGPDSAPAHSKP